MPENNYLSVTVHAPSSAVADALSTALFNMTIDEASAVISGMDSVEVTFITNAGEIEIISSQGR